MAELCPVVVEVEPQDAILVRAEVAVADLPAFFGRAFRESAEAADYAGVDLVGPPIGLYPRRPGETVLVEAGFPVSAPAAPRGYARPVRLPGCRAVEAIHVGPYDTIGTTYATLQAWMAEQGLEPADGIRESYLSDPDTEPDPARWETRILWPVSGTAAPRGAR